LYFSKDAKKHKIGTDFFTDKEKEKEKEGEYKIDYSNKPVQLEINWFIEGKNQKVRVSFGSSERKRIGCNTVFHLQMNFP